MSLKLGWGTYRVPHVANTAEAIVAVGCDWIDTAPNYSNGTAEKQLAPTLAAHGGLAVSTKAGFFTRVQAAEALEARVINAEAAAAGHSITPAYVRWQIARSSLELGRDRPDLVFVHNPEHACADRADLASAITKSFEELESAAFEQRIGNYGVATWSGFTEGAFTVRELVDLASQAAGGQSHHFTAIQLPVSLVNIDPIAEALNGRGPLAEATEAGLKSFVSSPLHGGDLPSLIDQELADLVGPSLSPAQAALAVLSGTPGIDRVLISTGSTAHWKDAVRAVSTRVPRSVTRRVVDVLA